MIESELSKTTQLSTPFGGMAELCLDTGTVFRDAEELAPPTGNNSPSACRRRTPLRRQAARSNGANGAASCSANRAASRRMAHDRWAACPLLIDPIKALDKSVAYMIRLFHAKGLGGI